MNGFAGSQVKTARMLALTRMYYPPAPSSLHQIDLLCFRLHSETPRQLLCSPSSYFDDAGNDYLGTDWSLNDGPFSIGIHSSSRFSFFFFCICILLFPLVPARRFFFFPDSIHLFAPIPCVTPTSPSPCPSFFFSSSFVSPLFLGGGGCSRSQPYLFLLLLGFALLWYEYI